ncbi:hypothetical protein F4819DRAFT_428299 [Hypoxylon fuscum]|nr:hypothetical protein F4819DRAFT_428299 [Hypoxylon fuscum]
MSQTPNSNQQVTTVETNNFNRVLEHFDEGGQIISPDSTRFDIDCPICLERKLFLLNTNFDQGSPETHESYTVLPKCGHAFGYHCLSSWLGSDNDTCPTCRTKVSFTFLSQRERELLFEPPFVPPLYGDMSDNTQQHDVIIIRGDLSNNPFLDSEGIEAPGRPAMEIVNPEELRARSQELLQIAGRMAEREREYNERLQNIWDGVQALRRRMGHNG